MRIKVVKLLFYPKTLDYCARPGGGGGAAGFLYATGKTQPEVSKRKPLEGDFNSFL